MILSLGPGSGADIGARLYADRLQKMWGQPVVIENRPGGDGVIAINAVIQAKDDHVLLWGPTANFVGHPYSLDKFPYDPKGARAGGARLRHRGHAGRAGEP